MVPTSCLVMYGCLTEGSCGWRGLPAEDGMRRPTLLRHNIGALMVLRRGSLPSMLLRQCIGLPCSALGRTGGQVGVECLYKRHRRLAFRKLA